MRNWNYFGCTETCRQLGKQVVSETVSVWEEGTARTYVPQQVVSETVSVWEEGTARTYVPQQLGRVPSARAELPTNAETVGLVCTPAW